MTTTRRPRKPRQTPPPVGAVFLMPLPGGSGRFGACRVLQRQDGGRKSAKALVLVGTCAWVGDAPIDAVDERLRPLLILTRYMHRSALIWIFDTVPDNFTLLGTLPPTEAEAEMQCGWSSSNWSWLAGEAAAQWRWEHDRETVLREEAEKAAADAARELANRDENEARRKREQDAMTLDSLRAETGLKFWCGVVPLGKIKATRAILLQTLDDLSALGSTGDTPKVRPTLRILRQCALSLNDLDRPRPFIETTERDDLCELIDKMAYVAGIRPKLKPNESVCDRWREW